MKVGTTDDAATKVVCQWRDSSLAWGEDSRVAPPTQTAARGFRRMRRAPCRRDFSLLRDLSEIQRDRS
jgi:hypothetical protein